MKQRVCAALLLLAGQVGGGPLQAESVAVLHPEGVVRGFLFLKSLDGVVVANGDLSQFTVGRASYSATRFRVKIELGGLAGVVAPLVGKQPKDTAVWILGGDAPGFVKSEGPFFQGGPVWRMELAAPDYPRAAVRP